jgi:hypothetical protein
MVRSGGAMTWNVGIKQSISSFNAASRNEEFLASRGDVQRMKQQSVSRRG